MWQAWHLVTWTLTLCGRPGTDLRHWVGTGDALVLVTRWVAAGHRLCVAGVALGDMDLHFNSTRTQLTHTQLTYTQLPHTQLTYTQLTYTQLTYTQLTYT